jgi:hypothetical protein
MRALSSREFEMSGSIGPSASICPIRGNCVDARDDLTRMSKIGKPVRVVRVQPFVPAPMVPHEVPTAQPVR